MGPCAGNKKTWCAKNDALGMLGWRKKHAKKAPNAVKNSKSPPFEIRIFASVMKIENSHIPGLKVIQPTVFADARGYFFEAFNKAVFEAHNLPTDFVQDNESKSQKGVVRGLHFQAPPFAQGKLVRVIKGAVLDVAVDIRKGSPTYGQAHVVELTESNKTMFWIPSGFAHGFHTLADDTIFSYKCTQLYNKQAEGAVYWNDPALQIDWRVQDPILSDKDREAPLLQNFDSPFVF
jgi:dTDP-4-dehydrorhamnose 3,5-epimerase